MRHHPYSRKQNGPFKPARKFIDPDALNSGFVRRVDQAANLALKGTLWLGYGFALVAWFVAVNTVIVFSQMRKCK